MAARHILYRASSKLRISTRGGEGVGYHASHPGNKCGAYRSTGVNICPTTDTGGGFDVLLLAGDWLRYTINVTQAGAYRLEIRMLERPCEGRVSAEFRVFVDGAKRTPAVPVPPPVTDFAASCDSLWDVAAIEPLMLSVGLHVVELRMADQFWQDYPSIKPWPGAVRANFLEIHAPKLRASVPMAGTGRPGFADGPADQAQFSAKITGLDLDLSGNVYVADAGNLRVRKVSPAGQVTTLAGNGAAGSLDGAGPLAQFLTLDAFAVDNSGNSYVLDSDTTNSLSKVREITPAGIVSTIYQQPKNGGSLTEVVARSFGEIDLGFSGAAPWPDGAFSGTSVLELGQGQLTPILPASAFRSIMYTYYGLSTGHSSNLYYVRLTSSLGGGPPPPWIVSIPPQWELTRLSPSGAKDVLWSLYNTLVSIVGSAADASGQVYAILSSGAIWRVWPDPVPVQVVSDVGWVPHVGTDVTGNLYGFLNNRLHRIYTSYAAVHLAAFADGGGSVAALPPSPCYGDCQVKRRILILLLGVFCFGTLPLHGPTESVVQPAIRAWCSQRLVTYTCRKRNERTQSTKRVQSS